MNLQCFQIDAFTSTLFSGNPACVVPLQHWPSDNWLQSVARENNVSETAFFVPNENASSDEFQLRWFTPEIEMDLCGHATLSAAHVAFEHLDFKHDAIQFDTRSGRLSVKRLDQTYAMDFPTRSPDQIDAVPDATDAIGCQPVETWNSTRDLMLVLPDESSVRLARPDFARIRSLPCRALIITAAADAEHVDFVSRFFAPAMGVDEDPVTGSAHCVLAPYWRHRLQKNKLIAQQVGPRGGEIQCRFNNQDGRVELLGQAQTYMIGNIASE